MRAELKSRARKARLVLLLGACWIASGCGESQFAEEPSAAAQLAVARRFAEAIFHGNAAATAGLLVHPDDPGLSRMARRAAAPWKTHHAAVRLSGTRPGGGWVFRYVGTHPHRDGRFEEVRGDMVVVVAASVKGAAVEFFTFRNEQIRFRTHHDSLLLPSDR